ncbi:MAG: DoxX family protein [Bacteroidetes bacterium]|nr:DoxX family protein [Bacteroidota bacterium]
MKKMKIVYWATTGLFCFMMAFSAFSYLTNPELKAAFAHLGFPDYFRVELALAKALGVLALLLPVVPPRVKEWAYAGFVFTELSAMIAHLALGDPAQIWIFAFVLLGILLTSYACFRRLQAVPALKMSK